MLMALDLPLPKKIFGHPWLLFGEDKMSKSKGNIVYADDLVKYFSVDAVRYYLLHEMPFSSDGTFTYDLLIDRINSDLANILGNLVNRTISMANKYFEGNVEDKKLETQLDIEYKNNFKQAPINIEEKISNVRVSDALEIIIELFRSSNKYIDDTTPWSLAKEDSEKDRLETVLYNLLEGIRKAAILLQAFLPDTAEEIFRQLNTENKDYENVVEKYHTNSPSPLFERIDKSKKMEEIHN
jgi:methionyl-tRNA synthetase